MDRETKLKALLATAQAFADRGEWLQYDQLCMDRVDTITPRRQDFAAPEAATSQRKIFLDCSGFVWDCFFQTFNYMLEADLTWHIIDQVTPRIYYKKLTHQETDEEIDQIREELQALLQPGDVITFSNDNGNGHTMLYVDKDSYINCSGHGSYKGYHYKENRNIYAQTGGGVYPEDSRDLLWMCDDPVRNRNCLFKENKKCFAVHRPLDLVGDPTPDAMARIGRASGLIVSVLNNYPGGRTAEPGAELEYTVVVRNKNEKTVDLEVSFEAGVGSMGAKEFVSGRVEAGAEKSFSFKAKAGNRDVVEAPVVYVNGLHVDAPMILVGHNLSAANAEKLVESVKNALAAGTEIQTAISCAYAQLGVSVYPLARQSMRRLFFLHDSLTGDVLSRRSQIPAKDMNVRTYYGGRGVVTPQSGSMFGIRTVTILASDLQPGDIICYADGANFENASEALWTGSDFLGIEGDPGTFIETLFGRFVFAVLRPSMSLTSMSLI